MLNESHQMDMPVSEVIISAMFLTFVNFGIIVGNFLVFLIIWRTTKLHKPNYYLLCSLSLADLLVGLFYCPLLIATVVERGWKFGSILCEVHAVSICVSLNASLMSLCAISVDRYFFITKPLSYKGIVTKRKSLYCIVFIWCHSIFWAVVPLFGWGEYTFENSTSTCKPNWNGEGLVDKSYAIGLATVCFLFPVLVMIFAYSRIYTVARKQLKGIQIPGESNETVRRSLIKKHRAFKTVLIVIGMFFVCWSVYTSVSLWKLFATITTLPHRLVRIGVFLAVANSSVNFYIYAVRDRVFRMGLGKLFVELRDRTKRSNLSHVGGTPVATAQLDHRTATVGNKSPCVIYQTAL